MTPTPAVRRWLYPGTFDPPTLGHLDLIQRALPLCDDLVVAVAENREKRTLLPLADRLALMETVTATMDGLRVLSFDTLLTEQVRTLKVNAVLRGVRAFSDFEYELVMALTNRKLLPTFETIFMMPSEPFLSVSSSLVKEIFRYGGDVSAFVPPAVLARLQALGTSSD
ncbi:MAG: pantetheine-phosphate adenylyltransferase [Candidatus Krumholzibacteriia bacterium]|nr:pantetheine-phosphate adenylyltransferase [bacterium]MCB9514981.1 pantetheine-phosphate adenylyltransferase [Candidatus Latescibacterota bacterium]